MISKADRLTQCLQTTQQFATARIKQNADFQLITQELEKVSLYLKSRKLIIQIFSCSPIFAQGLYQFLKSQQPLQTFYQFQLSDFLAHPNSVQLSIPSALMLQANSAIGQQQTRYELSPSQSILIGRDHQRLTQDFRSEDAQLVALSSYRKVSGVHALVQVTADSSSTGLAWQICDLNSTNGTYINGQKIKGCRILQAGDRITLAYSTAGEKAPEFVFEGQTPNSTQIHPSLQLIEGDLICLVIDSKQGLTAVEKQLIEQLSKAQIAGLIIIADMSGTSSQDSQQLNANLTKIDQWIETHHPQLHQIRDISHLALHPFYPNAPATPIPPDLQQKLDKFCENLLLLAKKKGTEIFTNRISRQLQSQIQRFEQLINAQEKALTTEIQRTEAMLQGRTLDSWRELTERAKKKIAEEREEFFRQARTELSWAKKDFAAADVIPNNLMEKIDAFTKNLEPKVTELQGKVCIQLQPRSSKDLHQAMLQFCQAELIQWGNQQWERICRTLDEGGLQGLLQRSYTQLNRLPSLQLTNAFNPPPQIDFRNSLDGSFIEVQMDISYAESSGDAFGGIARIAILAAGAAIGLGSGSPYAVIQGASAIAGLMKLIGESLDRPKQQQLKLEQVIDSLRRNSSTHYKKIALYLLERVSRDIEAATNAADRQFRKSLAAFDEQFRNHFTELRTASEGYKVRRESIKQDKRTLEQIKRLGV